MKDSLNTLFQQRFQGHEAPVDPGVWQGIQQQMAHVAPAAGEDGVGRLFKERFQGHQVAVDPSVWSAISSQLGHTAVAGTATGSAWLGWAAAGVVAIAVATAALVSSVETGRTTSATEEQTVVSGPEAAPLSPEMSATLVSTPAEVVKEVKAEPSPFRAPITRRSAVAAQAPQVSTSSTSEPGTPEEAVTQEPASAGTLLPVAGTGEAIVERIIDGMTKEVEQEVKTQPLPVPAPLPPATKPAAIAAEPAEVPTPELGALPKLFMPNTFTPNGDGVNDEYEVGGSHAYEHVIIRISSLKSGQLVFSTNSGELWRGEGCEDGMYVVALEARTADGRTLTEGKVVWLNRNPMN